MTFEEAKQALARKLDIDYADIANNDLFSAADLGDYVQAGVNRAWDYKPWSFKESTKKFTSLNAEYYDYPTTFEDESITRLTVGGKEYRKLNFTDYQKLFEDDPSSTEKVWSEHERFVFINQSAYSVGNEINATGMERAPTLANAGDLLPFSPDTDNQENSGNRAIVLFAYGEALSSDKMNNPAQGVVEERRAQGILERVWAPMAERRSFEQSQGRPVFDVPDFFKGGSPSKPIDIWD